MRGCPKFLNCLKLSSLLHHVDGSPVPNLDVIELPSVYSVRIIKDMAQSLIYGAAGQFGAVIITTRGMQKETEE